MNPGERIERLWFELQVQQRPWHSMFVQRRIRRAEMLASIAQMRKILDEIEGILRRKTP